MQADVKYELENLRPNLFLQETEDSWEKISKALMSLIKLCDNGAYDTNPTDLVGAIKAAHRPIISAMNSERTRLCLVPMDLMGSLATAMGMDFEQLLPLFMPPLLTNCARTNKVVINHAKTSILTIIEVSQPASVLTYFLQNIKDKSASMKVAITEGTLACLNSCNPPDIEKEARALEIEGIIRITARDANADVRKLSRKIFESYTILLPSRVKNFTAPLSPTTKKYLDVKVATTSVAPNQKSSSSLHNNLNLKPEVKPKPSAGPSSSIAASKPSHSRTTSSTTLSTGTNGSQLPNHPTTMTRVNRKEPAAPSAAPAPYVPMRPLQPSRVMSGTHKTVPQRPTNVTATRTTANQDEKRPIPPLRTQRSVISRITQGSTTSSSAPHRVQITSETRPAAASGSQLLPSTGPRRIPMPPPPPPAPKKETEGPKRPAPRVDNASSSSHRPIVPPAPMKKKSGSTLSSSLRDRAPPSNPSTNYTRTKSSAVATDPLTASTSVATASSNVKPLAVAKAKPLWGRSAPPAKSLTASQKAPVKAAVPVVKKPSSRVIPASKPATAIGSSNKQRVIPEMVALPPSPPPAGEEEVIAEAEIIAQDDEAVSEVHTDVEENVQSAVSQRHSPIPSQLPDIDIVEVEEDVEEIQTNDQNETVSSSTTETTAVYPTSINNKENIPIPEIQTTRKADDVAEEDEDSSSLMLPRDENPRTPQQGLMPFPSANAAAGKTPISALLSSIERGFKYDYSPITPLSPADSYLPNINGATPYSHHTHAPHIKGPMQPFNHALHAPGHSGIFGGFGGAAKRKEELVHGDIGVVQLSEYNKVYMTTSLPGLDDGRQTFIELNKN